MKTRIKLIVLAITVSYFAAFPLINFAANKTPHRLHLADTYVNEVSESDFQRQHYNGAEEHQRFNPPSNIHMFRGSHFHKRRVAEHCHKSCENAHNFRGCFRRCLSNIEYGEPN